MVNVPNSLSNNCWIHTNHVEHSSVIRHRNVLTLVSGSIYPLALLLDFGKSSKPPSKNFQPLKWYLHESYSLFPSHSYATAVVDKFTASTTYVCHFTVVLNPLSNKSKAYVTVYKHLYSIIQIYFLEYQLVYLNYYFPLVTMYFTTESYFSSLF